MKNAKQKKRRNRLGTSNPFWNDVAANEEDEEGKEPKALVEAFSLASLHDAISAYRQADEDRDEAAHVFRERVPDIADYPSANWTSGASSSGSSEGFVETGYVQNVVNGKGFVGSKQKRVVAATGTVSTVLGKEYVKSRPLRRDSTRFKGLKNGFLEIEEAEQFLCSMLGDECELSMAVVRDVLGQCGYDVEKALDALLEFSASTFEQSGNGNYKEDIRFLFERKGSFTDRASDCTSCSSESEVLDNIWSMGNGYRNYAKVLASSEADSTPSERSTELDLPQKVLESLFHISKSPNHEPKTMNWKNVVKKLQSLGPGFDVCPSSVAEPQQDTCAKGEEYHVFRKTSQQHWDSMRSYNQKAAVAFSKGERHHAAYLSEQGKVQTKLAREADERASHDIFKARNKGIENVITIDLHGQHVKQAMQYVKALLLLGTYAPAVQTLRLITGCGSHGVGKSKVKESVIKLMQKEGIKWSEENRGTLLIKLSGSREFTFMDSESDTDPLFVTWKKVVNGGEPRLRGCIGTLDARWLINGFKDYALNSALRDRRFSPIQAKELPSLECTVSILTDYETANHYLDWEVGKHGIIIEFTDPDNNTRRSATYLPEVASHEGWTKIEAIDSLMRKAGYNGSITESLRKRIKLTRYQSTLFTMQYSEYVAYVKATRGAAPSILGAKPENR